VASTVALGIVDRFLDSLRTRGLSSTCRHYTAVLINFGYLKFMPSGRRQVREQSAKDAEFAWRQKMDADFDRRHGVDTAGKVELARPEESTFYQGAASSEVYAVCETLSIDPKQYTFVDIGAGKGRVLMIASLFGFARIEGVEFAKELVAVCRNNLDIFSANNPSLCAPTVLCMDALEYEIPKGPLVIFMNNPFNGKLFESFARRVRTARVGSDAPCFIAYVAPLNHDALIEAIPELRVIKAPPYYASYILAAAHRQRQETPS
jgi:hypothetical protein